MPPAFGLPAIFIPVGLPFDLGIGGAFKAIRKIRVSCLKRLRESAGH